MGMAVRVVIRMLLLLPLDLLFLLYQFKSPTMHAAAQQHMQKSLATKLESIGVPLPGHLRKEAGLTRGVESYEVPDAIPLPGDSDIAAPSVDMSIADIAPPEMHIPMPPGAGGEYDDIAAPEAENQDYNSQQQQQQQAKEAQYQEYQNQQEYYQQEYNQQEYNQHQEYNQ